ncbi:ABC transporter ATP-binding protein [Lentzea tibetensis]|uniref:ABC transporter ATP-binding protein n=1 Tax=Lentzea tibetensis TaxID=2591470 RepID=A0A563EYD4_9PSEU|nr:ABC transporter ATP-binding protein [Lentzea tibetensis]TWP52154.1 ABC transporter ATP-binding protein [Lentzea tibetensis]
MHGSALAAIRLTWRAARAGTLVTVAIAALSGAAVPVAGWLAKLLIDEVARGGDVDKAVALAVVATLAGTVAGVLTYVGSYVTARVQRSVSLHVQDELCATTNSLIGLRYFENPAFHDRVRLAAQAAHGAPGTVTDFGLEVVRKVFTIAGFLGAMLAIWPFMALLLLIAAIPAFVAQLMIARRNVEMIEAMTSTMRRQSYYQMLITEGDAAKEVRLFGLGDLFRSRMRSTLAETTGAELAVRRRSTITEAGFAVLNAAVAAVGTAVVVVGAIRGTVTLGDVSLFIAAVASLQGAFTSLIMQFARVTEALRLFRHYVDLVGSTSDMADGTRPVSALRKGIELRDVWFRYDEDGPWVLRGVTCTIPFGATVGLVGANGAGKSTLVKLLCRLYDPDRGTIHWDGVDIRELTVAQLRERIAAVFQDYMSYDLSAAENIGIGSLPDLDDRAKIRSSAQLVDIDEKISGLANGYDTLISRMFIDPFGGGGGGVNFSGGQWQRLAIARSLMRTDADLLIMDEPSAGLDATAEHRLGTTLRERRAGRTSLLISHRLNTMRDADVIVVLSGGRIAEQGSHDELMAADGEYSGLFRLQAEHYQDDRVVLP